MIPSARTATPISVDSAVARVQLKLPIPLCHRELAERRHRQRSERAPICGEPFPGPINGRDQRNQVCLSRADPAGNRPGMPQ